MSPVISALFKSLPRLTLPVQGVLVALVGWQLGLATWQLLPLSGKPTDAVAPPYSLGTAPNRDDSLSALGRLTLFGTPVAKTTAAPAVPSVAPVTRLPARITGLVASSDPEQSRVIIKMHGQDAVYRIGEVLKGVNARIENIYPDRVIIDHNGKFESLLMYPDEAPRAAVEGAAPARALSLKERLQQNPASWSDIVSITPAMEDGRMRGYRLNPGREQALFRKYGLQPGDLATAINGHTLSNPQQAMKLISELATARSLLLSIERDGQPVEVTIGL